MGIQFPILRELVLNTTIRNTLLLPDTSGRLTPSPFRAGGMTVAFRLILGLVCLILPVLNWAVFMQNLNYSHARGTD